jgi:predicted DsbA family dithiol-disulfide isomerase
MATATAAKGASRVTRSRFIHDQLSGIAVKTSRVAGVVDVIGIEIFYDYNCPFVYRAAKMLEAVAMSGQRQLEVNWRFFSLTQVNHRSDDPDDGWTVWAASESEHVKGRLAFQAAEAARRQERFDPFHIALLDARHRDRLDIERQEVVEQVAVGAGLDLDDFRRDVASPDILERLERDHTEARDRFGVFGTPTFVFPDGSAYLRLAHVLEGGAALRVFDSVVGTIAREPEVLEIKRPVPPVAG